MMTDTAVYLEIGKKKVAAGAIDWPGWCRIGRSEEAALAALVDCGARYGRLLPKSLGFRPPDSVSELDVVERLEGSATTDFGAPDKAPAADEAPVGEADLERFKTILEACWKGFDTAVINAAGKELQKGPRGGGRELEGIMEHVLEADRSYLRALGGNYKRDKSAELPEALAGCRAAILAGLEAAVQGEIAPEGPRGGKRWLPRYFVRRVAWHVVDHIWEIEDRVL